MEALGFCNRPASPLAFHQCVSDSPKRETWLPRIAIWPSQKRLENLQVFNPQASKHQRVNWQIRQCAQPQIATADLEVINLNHLCHFHFKIFPNFPTNLEVSPFELSPHHTSRSPKAQCSCARLRLANLIQMCLSWLIGILMVCYNPHITG